MKNLSVYEKLFLMAGLALFVWGAVGAAWGV